jgi:hypothetical protein
MIVLHLSNEAEPEMKGLSLAQKEKNTSGNVDTKNIALGKRTRKSALKRKSKGSPANKNRDLTIKVVVPALDKKISCHLSPSEEAIDRDSHISHLSLSSETRASDILSVKL